MRYTMIKLTFSLICDMLSEKRKGLMDVIRVIEANYRWGEKEGFSLVREAGLPHYIIAQYLTRIDLRIGDETMPTSPGSVAVFAPNIPHGYRCDEPLLHHWLHVEGDLAPLLTKYGIKPNRLYQLQNADELSTVFRQIALTYHDRGQFRDDYMALKIEELLIAMGMQHRLEKTVTDLNYNVVVRLRALRLRLMERPEDDWTVAKMASAAYLSESYFYALYRKCFGVTPNHDLIRFRLDHARTNLCSGYSVAETAERVGYANVHHFIRQFKKVVGVTPNQYKKMGPMWAL